MGARIYSLRPAQEAVFPDKEYANLRAQAALQGATLHRIEDERGTEAYVVSKWHLTRQLPTLEAVAAWLDRLGGRI
jgi:hypothetical protein